MRDRQPQVLTPIRLPFGIASLLLIGVAVILAGTMALWLHYGTAVFFEMIATGIAACF